MDFIEVYLQKHQFVSKIDTSPSSDLNCCIVIPCYKEPDLIRTLQSLWNCTRPHFSVEIIIVINAPENCPKEDTMQNEKSMHFANEWIKNHVDAKINFYIVHSPNLPTKHAGVGLARKIGMDEAANRFWLANNKNGIIAGFDADSICDENYLVEMEHHFTKNPKIKGATIYFEHPIFGTEFSTETYCGITLYELHLRYLNLALLHTGHPFAWHTVGSSFAVRVDAYVQQGGMNKRQAGEDFYFLQKIIESYGFSEINTTRIIPSPRISDRVPFGTGASMTKWHKNNILLTYNLQAYSDLKLFFDEIKRIIHSKESFETINSTVSNILLQFLNEHNFEIEIKSIVKNSGSTEACINRFFRWFNAFKAIKFLNYAHELTYQKTDIVKEASKLLQKMNIFENSTSEKEMLEIYRKLERNNFYTEEKRR